MLVNRVVHLLALAPWVVACAGRGADTMAPPNGSPTVGELSAVSSGKVSWTVTIAADDPDRDSLRWELSLGERAEGPYHRVDAQGRLASGTRVEATFDDTGATLAYLRLDVDDGHGGATSRLLRLESRLGVYVYAPARRRVFAYAPRLESASLETLANAAAPEACYGLSADPLGRYVYASDSRAGPNAGRQIWSYRVDRERGTLTEASRSEPFSFRLSPGDLSADQSYVYLAGGGAFTGTHGGLFRFELDAATGALQSRPFGSASIEPTFVVAGRHGHNVYAGGRRAPRSPSSGGTQYVIESHAIDADGAMRELEARADRYPSGAAHGGPFLFVAGADRIASYRLDDSGVPLPLASYELGVGFARWEANVATDPLGRRVVFVYDDALLLYSVDANGELTATDRLDLPRALYGRWAAFDPSARVLFVSRDKSLRTFSVDEHGRLAEGAGAADGGGPLDLVRFGSATGVP